MSTGGRCNGVIFTFHEKLTFPNCSCTCSHLCLYLLQLTHVPLASCISQSLPKCIHLVQGSSWSCPVPMGDRGRGCLPMAGVDFLGHGWDIEMSEMLASKYASRFIFIISAFIHSFPLSFCEGLWSIIVRPCNFVSVSESESESNPELPLSCVWDSNFTL